MNQEIFDNWMLIEWNHDSGFDFKVFEITSFNGIGGHSNFSLEDVREKELIISGIIKYDGCSNMYFGEEAEDYPNRQDGYIHVCGKSGAIRLSKVILRLYEIAESVMEDVKDS